MGSSCSSRQGHKDKDSVSTRSEESPGYQVIVKKYSDDGAKVTSEQKNHSEVILKPGELVSGTAVKPERNVASSASDTISIPSPPILSPRELSEPPLPAELTQLSETFRNLITGRIANTSVHLKSRKIVLYVCAADSQDCCVEKGVLHQVVGPELRGYCRDKGYELHISDLHWKTGLEKQQDHEFPELCLGELARQMEVGYIIPVLFLSNSLGTPLLPKTVETQDFEMALSQAEDKDSLKKWYKLDSDAQPPCYRLQPVASHIPGFKENSLEQREKALEEWRSEIERTLTAMITAFSEELRNTYLTTVIEQEVHNTILMSQELARRCLWLYRFFTQRPESSQPQSLLAQEQKRRLDIVYKELRSQLTEKHVVRVNLKWNQDGVINKNIPEHAQYISDVTSHLLKYLKATIFNIIEEDQSKAVIRSTYGIEAAFLNELKWQALFCQKAAQSSVNREQILQQIHSYVLGDGTFPLLVHGIQGSGKSTVLSRTIHCIQTWLPDSYSLFRYTKISELSHNLIDVLKSVCDQMCLLCSGHETQCNYNINIYGKLFLQLISEIALQRPVIVVLDGLDHIKMADVDWLPHKLPNNAKLILSSRTDSFLFRQFKSKLQTDKCFVEIPELSKTEAERLLLSSVTQYSHSVSSKAARSVLSTLQHCRLPLYVKALAWRISWFTEVEYEFKQNTNLHDEINSVLDHVDAILDKNRVKFALSLISASKYGLLDSELLDMLSHETTFHSEKTYLKWAPACLFLSRLSKYLSPFLHWISDGNHLALRISDSTFDEIIRQRYSQQNKQYREIIQAYFMGSWHGEKCQYLVGKYLSQPNKTEKCYNKRKLVELPYQSILLKQNSVDEFFLNSSWLFDKICGTGVFQVLDDLEELNRHCSLSKDLEILKHILENSHYALNYDGRQMYTQFREELKRLDLSVSPHWKSFYEATESPQSVSLMPVVKLVPRVGHFAQPASENLDQNLIVNINLIVRLIDNPNFVVSVSTEKEEISVWDLSSCEKVRCLTGITHPISLQLIDDTRAVVLCRRELRIYNLDEGALVTKLKGVMNQKMAYFGLHDKNHLVTLSRNRMYVNLMHLESGDCITTFKAGEDRFLNSLLVSGDGRILVCGDETQKPFPLLVWNLSSRKLLYDLRIPHHDFITSLSAITHEGHYVCCVAKEVVEPGPNFIVVYDLQNGTLFKKWKPGVDTTSLDISSKDSCVISGLADARILVWDLVTGNCRWSLRGHSAPVTLLRRDPCGGCFLSADALNRDRSIRLWNLNKGELLAVYTPPKPFSACELGIGGKMIALSLKGEDEIVSLELKGPGIESSEKKSLYGKEENHGKTFNLSEGPDVVMAQLVRLPRQNTLSRLVSSYMMACPGGNCSGHGECMNGTCLCEIQYDGEECLSPNIPYYVGFATVFFILALVCMIQLIMCIVAEYHKMKSPSFLRACRITTQKLLYFLVFLAAIIRGAYFTSPNAFREGWSSSLMSAYYPLLLSGSSLLVCFWAEVFHLRDIRWERNQFLSKSFLGFVTFNILTYSLLIAEFITTKVSMTAEKRLLQQHIFNGCYAVLLFIVVIFFLIYGVEVFFKVRGGFLGETVTNISTRTPSCEKNEPSQVSTKLCTTLTQSNVATGVDISQLNQSRFGLLAQAFMLIIIVGFLFSETLSEFWKSKAPIYTRNWHDITFRIVEIGVALWFPCVLWNCMSPDQLWILNPRRLLKKLEQPSEDLRLEKKSEVVNDGTESLKDCWICYDVERTDAGPLIQPCHCSGDVSSVHHDCLRRWLVESSSTSSSKEALSCKVCKCPYEVEKTQKLDWQNGFDTQHWLKTAVIVTVMCVAGAGAWAAIQLFTDQYIRLLSASLAVLVWYICARFLGMNTVVAYNRAKVSGMNIVSSVPTMSAAVDGKSLEPVHKPPPKSPK